MLDIYKNDTYIFIYFFSHLTIENPVFFDTGNFRKNKAKIWDDEPQYKFDAFGKHFHLVLNHDSGFVHPEIKVSFHFQSNLNHRSRSFITFISFSA